MCIQVDGLVVLVCCSLLIDINYSTTSLQSLSMGFRSSIVSDKCESVTCSVPVFSREETHPELVPACVL